MCKIKLTYSKSSPISHYILSILKPMSISGTLQLLFCLLNAQLTRVSFIVSGTVNTNSNRLRIFRHCRDAIWQCSKRWSTPLPQVLSYQNHSFNRQPYESTSFLVPLGCTLKSVERLVYLYQATFYDKAFLEK